MVTQTLTRVAGRLSLGADLRKVLRAAGLVMFVQIAASALSYLTQILLARWLGPFEFGVYVFAWSWAVLLPILASMGMSQAVVRFVPEYLAREEWGRLHGLLRRGPAIVVVGGLLVAVIGWLVVTALGSRVPSHYLQPVRVALLCVPLLGSIAFFGEVSRGFGRVGLAFVPQQLIRPGLFLGAVAVLSTMRGLDAAAVLQVSLGACLATTLLLLVLFRSVVSRQIRSASPQFHMREWLRVALPLFLADGIFLILWNVDTLMLGALRPPEDVAIYDACMKTAGLTFFVFTAMSALAAPKFTELHVRQDRPALQHFVRSIARWTFWPSVAVAAGVAIAGPRILGFFGPTFVAGYSSLLVLTAGYLTYSITGPTNAYLAASGHQDDIIPAMASASVSNIALNALLIPRYGVMGAAIASVVSVVIARVWLYIAVRRRLGLETLFLGRGPTPR